MSSEAFERHIPLEGAFNFRDLGGYRTQDGRAVKWRGVFRSDELSHLTDQDVGRLRGELNISTVIDLRSEGELVTGGADPISDLGVSHHNIAFSGSPAESNRRIQTSANMGEVYLKLISQPGFGTYLLKALTLIAELDNQPLVFHCTAGKDRTGVLSAVLLGVLGIPDNDIVADYALSHEAVAPLIRRIQADPKRAERLRSMPRFVNDATPESMELFLSHVGREHGSMRGYVQAQGGDAALFQQLENVLLE